MREGSLEAPTRHPDRLAEPGFLRRGEARRGDAPRLRHLPWLPALLQSVRQLSRACSIWSTSRRPASWTSVDSKDFKPVVDACTLCDMCFMTKCPYVPPHEFNLDFPHLMLRYRAAELRAGQDWHVVDKQLTETDRNGKLGSALAPLANWATATDNKLTRPALEKIAGVDRNAALPTFHRKTFDAAGARGRARGQQAGAGLWPQGGALRHLLRQLQQSRRSAWRRAPVLAQNGVETEVVYPALLRHAAARARRPRARRRAMPASVSADARALDRQGLRRRRAGAVLRADAEIRMAADRARRSRR